MFVWEVALFGPPDTLYQGGYFKVRICLVFVSFCHTIHRYTSGDGCWNRRPKALDINHCKQPTLWLHDLSLKFLTVHGTELRLFEKTKYHYNLWVKNRLLARFALQVQSGKQMSHLFKQTKRNLDRVKMSNSTWILDKKNGGRTTISCSLFFSQELRCDFLSDSTAVFHT